MRAVAFALSLLLLSLSLNAAEMFFDLSELKEGQLPSGFRSTLFGEGEPGEWKVLMDSVPSAMQALTPQAPSVAKRPVLAQVSQDTTDERFPMLIYDRETFSDFTLTTRFKTVAGKVEQMAGIAFRVQNDTNYYVVRGSSLGNTFRFYKVVNGQRGNIIGPEVPVPSGIWHELTVQCKGNTIRCLLNGQELIPTLTDNSFSSGKIAFWTKSDSVSYFADTKVIYTPREPPAQTLVMNAFKDYPRLLGLKIYVPGHEPGKTRIVGSTDPKEVDQPGTETEAKVIRSGEIYYAKTKESASVIMPLRDRNGDPIAAARVVLKTFAGQTQQNAIIRATPIVKSMQADIQSMEDLVQ